MSRGSCSHCWGDDHDKRRCPHRDRPHADLVAEYDRKTRAFYETCNAVAKLVAQYAPDERIRLLVEAFKRAGTGRAAGAAVAIHNEEQAAAERLRARLPVVVRANAKPIVH